MKRLLLIAVLAIVATPVFAAPVQVCGDVDSTITSDLITLCNRIRDRAGYSANGWTPTGACIQAVINAGFRVLADEEIRIVARQFGSSQQVVKYDELYDPIDTGLAINDPPKIVCGDGFVDTSEQCDDGAGNSDAKVCTSFCRTAICGDGVLCNDAACTSGPAAGPEACDDGNNFNNDGCSAICAVE